MAEAPKGVFDHLAEYLLQPPVPGEAPAAGPPPQPAAPAPPAVHETNPGAEGDEALDREAPASPTPSGSDNFGQTLVFVETAEKLVVEKELFVREEVVLRKLVDNRVEDIKDSVRRTEVEVQRLSPDEAERIAAPPMGAPAAPPPETLLEPPAPAARVEALKEAPQVPLPAPRAQPAKPIAAAARKQAPAESRRSATWWLWFALILCAAMLIAFTAGQFLGSASG